MHSNFLVKLRETHDFVECENLNNKKAKKQKNNELKHINIIVVWMH